MFKIEIHTPLVASDGIVFSPVCHELFRSEVAHKVGGSEVNPEKCRYQPARETIAYHGTVASTNMAVLEESLADLMTMADAIFPGGTVCCLVELHSLMLRRA
jgi:hypothetical protein